MSMIIAAITQYEICFIFWRLDIFGNLYLWTQQSIVRHALCANESKSILSIVMHHCIHFQYRTNWGSRIATDHKILTRKTTAGNTAVLVVVECFSGYPHLIPVQDTTAKITARALVQHAIPAWGMNFELYSDKGLSFTSALFANVNRLLGTRHVTSAAMTARSNGQAESVVKRLVEHLKIYAKDDLCIKERIPLLKFASEQRQTRSCYCLRMR